MLAGGLRDDFRARVINATYAPWDYDGNIDEPVLAGKLTLQPLDDDGEPLDGEEGEPFDQHWSAGDLNSFVPSEDGRTPAEAEDGGPGEGPYALKVGKRAQLNNNTNWAHLIEAILDAGAAAKGKPFTEKNLTASAECFIGIDAQWNRVPQKTRKGLVDTGEEGERKQRRDVLVATEIYGYGEVEAPTKKSKPNGAAGKPKVRAAEPDEDEDEGGDESVSPLDAKLEKVVVKALAKAGGKLKKGKLAPAVLDALATDKDKSKGVRRVSEEDFLADEARPWKFDEDTGVLQMADEDEEEEEEQDEEVEEEEEEEERPRGKRR
jgi:hypothetical protein